LANKIQNRRAKFEPCSDKNVSGWLLLSHYKGTIIRTTHLSGVLTDLGLALGYRVRGLVVERRRVVLHLLILSGFLIGGLCASWMYPYLKLNSFLVPTALSLILSVVYWIIYFRYRRF